MAKKTAPTWAIVTATLCPGTAAVFLYFELYGGMVCALLASMAILLGSTLSFAAVPALVVGVYGAYEGIYVLNELWPWTADHATWEVHGIYVESIMGAVLTGLSVLLMVSAMVAAMRAPIYAKRSNRLARKRPDPQQVIVTEYRPGQTPTTGGAVAIPVSASPRAQSPVRAAAHAPQTAPAATPTPSHPAPAAPVPSQVTVPKLKAPEPVTVVQRTPSGTLYTNKGIVLPSGEVFTDIPSRPTQYVMPVPEGSPVAQPVAAAATPLPPAVPQALPPATARVQVTVTPQTNL